MDDTEKICLYCKWWKSPFTIDEVDQNSPYFGECRRKSPAYAGWPKSMANDWCGDFEKHKEEAEES